MNKNSDNIIAICVFLSGFSCFAQLYYFQPLLPDLSNEFSLSASHSSFAVSFATLGMVFGLFTMMFIADQVSRKKLISVGLLTSSVFSVASSFSPSFYPLVILNMLKGFLLSGATSVSMAYITEEVQPQNKSKIMGLYIAGNALGGMSGRVITSWISALTTWRIASVSIGILCALFAVAFMIFSPESRNFKPHRENFRQQLVANLKLVTCKALIPFYLSGGLMLGIFVSLYNYLGFFLIQPPFNFPAYYIHYIYLMYIFGIFGSVATAKLTAKFSIYKVLKGTILLSVPAILLIYIHHFWLVTLGLAVFTFNFFVIHVICNRIVSEYDISKRSVTISIYLLTYYLGSSFLGSATGVMLDTMGWPYFLAGLMILVMIEYLIAYRGSKYMKARNDSRHEFTK